MYHHVEIPLLKYTRQTKKRKSNLLPLSLSVVTTIHTHRHTNNNSQQRKRFLSLSKQFLRSSRHIFS